MLACNDHIDNIDEGTLRWINKFKNAKTGTDLKLYKQPAHSTNLIGTHYSPSVRTS